MKKAISFIIVILSLVLILTGCKNDEDLNFVVALPEIEENGYTWEMEMSSSGVVSLMNKNTVENETIYLFEPVGSGEVTIDFYYEKDGSRELATRRIQYKMTVNENYCISGEMMLDEKIKPAEKLLTKEEAEEIISEKEGSESEKGNQIYVSTEKTEKRNNITYYLIRVSEVVKGKKGKSVLRFLKMYEVDEYGNIRLLSQEEYDNSLEKNKEIYLK